MLCDSTKMIPVCAVYSVLFLISARCLFHPPPRFDATDSVFPPTNQCKSISPSLVSSSLIFVNIGAVKSASTLSKLIVALAIMYCTLGEIENGFVL